MSVIRLTALRFRVGQAHDFLSSYRGMPGTPWRNVRIAHDPMP